MITDDWGIEINNGVFETGNGYCVVAAPEGLSSFGARFFDMARGSFAGDVSGIDVIAAGTLNFSWIVAGESKFDAAGNLDYVYPLRQALAVAFAPRDSSAEVPLDVKVPGAPTDNEVLRFYGRPRTFNTRRSVVAGYEAILATFKTLDPFAYGPEIIVSGTGSPITFTAEGDVPTDRFTFTVVGNGGTPSIISVTDDNKSMAFADVFGGTAVLDFRAQTIEVGGIDQYGLLSPAPEWFRIIPGSNSITFTGAASISIAYEPAYL